VSYSKQAADKAVGFINLLTHTDGEYAGSTFQLRDWQENDIVRPLFGTLNADGTRQYKEALIFISRKNGKSELVAALALLCLFGDKLPGKQIICAAGDRAQAKVVFGVAAQMVRNDKWLSSECSIIDSQHRIVHHPTNSILMAVSADAKLKHGLRPTVAIVDELHVMPNSELYNTLKMGMGANRQRLMIGITTAGVDDKNSLVRKKYDHAKQCLNDSSYDTTFLPVIYELDDGDDIWDESNWYKANPALGDFRLIEEMREFAEQAKKQPSLENDFRRYYLNQFVQQSQRWLQMHQWDSNTKRVDPTALLGQPCWGGVDLSSSNDISALVLVFPKEDGIHDVLSWYWLPKEVAYLRERKDGIPYSQWAREGLIELTDGDYIDTEHIRQRIIELDSEYKINSLAVDKFNAADLLAKLTGEGINAIAFGYKMYAVTAAAKELERLVATEKLNHGGNKVLRWMASNVEVITNAFGDLMPTKSKSVEKIDGIAALTMSLAVWLQDSTTAHTGKQAEPYYAKNDLIIL
jgi:phage terminase large subunit-like protein